MYRKTLLLLFVLSGTLALNAQILYVDANRPIDGDGSSWLLAYKSLTSALNQAHYNTAITEIRVTGGEQVAAYSPVSGDKANTFLITRGGLKITGGYAAGGSANPVPGKTSVLDGNRYFYHVMVIVGLASDAGALAISGFTIRGGRADQVLPGVIFQYIVSSDTGGGIVIMKNASKKIIFRNCIIHSNYAGNTGGGVHIQETMPTFMNCLFWGNYADYGGAAFNYDDSHANYINCTIAGNHDNHGGGGMRNSSSYPWIVNSIIYGNDGGIANKNSSPIIFNSLVEGLASLTLTMGGENLDGDTNNPQFAVPLAMPITTTPAQGIVVNYRLKLNSPAINKGSNTKYESDGGDVNTDYDLWGNPRLYGSFVDMGTFENRGTDPLPVHFQTVSAVVKNEQLLVNWSTETETNNDHFLIQASNDGVNFKTIQTIQSKAADGNSNGTLEYSSTITLSTITAAGLLLLIFGIGGASVRKRKYGLCLLLLGGVLFFSCHKTELQNLIDDGKLFVRIVQVDKDGTERTSKVVQVARN